MIERNHRIAKTIKFRVSNTARSVFYKEVSLKNKLKKKKKN